MKNIHKIAIIVSLASLFSTSAMAGVGNALQLRDGSQVTLSGHVESIESEREFTLTDDSGSIPVNIRFNEPLELKEGDNITVRGTLDKGRLGTSLDASRINVGGIKDTATAYEIRKLPAEGLVKVTGSVIAISNEKKFTLRDSTGAIKVALAPSEIATISKGSRVTVIGTVEKHLFSKTIDAQKLYLVNDATASR